MTSQHRERRRYDKVSADRTREELIYAVLSLPVECDMRMRALVETLNDLPDVYPCSSCGGHPDEEGRENPAPEGCFYLQFIVEPTETGFMSLGIIDLAARNVDCERLAVQVLNTTDSPRLVIFHMLGRDGADPDAVAEEIRALCRKWKVSLKGVREHKKNVRKQKALEKVMGSHLGKDPRR
ncbi:MAG TPA: hypothetical protein PK069_09945 [Methanolinea sp.]|nr:hypothetical protein [Methanolinea sp.]HQK56827.1 hypothetical protein [Methanolinea sp.]